MSKPALVVTSDFTKEFNDTIAKFKRDAVLVGIPEADAERKGENNEEQEAPISNAAILAINEFGSPINNIPPRPVMAIGIRNAQEAIAEELKKATKEALAKGVSVLSKYYNRAGLIASNSIKKAINSQDGIEGPSDATLAARESAGFKGTKALIVTGQMRNAITYVVKGEE
jgi:uncharacterized NAD-dependent epimerase/dehydratase family protein